MIEQRTVITGDDLVQDLNFISPLMPDCILGAGIYGENGAVLEASWTRDSRITMPATLAESSSDNLYGDSVNHGAVAHSSGTDINHSGKEVSHFLISCPLRDACQNYLFAIKVSSDSPLPQHGLMSILRLAAELFSERFKASRDSLTGLFNKDFFFFKLKNTACEVLRAFREKVLDLSVEESTKIRETVFSIALFDIDYFKKFNDSYGHQLGDEVLAKVAGTVKCTLKQEYPGSLVFRYGGEEFVCLFPGAEIEKACRLMDEARKKVATLELSFTPSARGRRIRPVTISAGVASFEPSFFRGRLRTEWQLDRALEELIYRADTALYAAKENGRNNVERFDRILMTGGKVLELIGDSRAVLSIGRMHGVQDGYIFSVFDRRFEGTGERSKNEKREFQGLFPKLVKGKVIVRKGFLNDAPLLQEKITIAEIFQKLEGFRITEGDCLEFEGIIKEHVALDEFDFRLEDSPEKFHSSEEISLELEKAGFGSGTPFEEVMFVFRNYSDLRSRTGSETMREVRRRAGELFINVWYGEGLYWFSSSRFLAVRQISSKNDVACSELLEILEKEFPFLAGEVVIASVRHEGGVTEKRRFEKLEIAMDAALLEERRTGNFGVEALCISGHADLLSGDFSAARTKFEMAVEISPADPVAWNNLGACLASLELLEEAISAFKKAIELDPDSIENWLVLGVASYKSGNFGQALEAFRRAASLSEKLEKKRSASYNNLANMLMETGENCAEALVYARKAVELAEEEDRLGLYLDTYGWACYLNGFLEEARDALSRAAVLERGNREIQEHLRAVNREYSADSVY